jgi:hypothetical protein
MKAKTKDVLFSAGIALLGALVGIVGTSYMNIYSDQKQKRNQLLIDSFTKTYSTDDGPKEFIDIKMLINSIKTYSAMDAAGIRDLALLTRKYPNCASTLSEECRPMMAKMINIMRKELNTSEVSEDDLKIILNPQYDKAIQAIKILNMN